MNIMFSGIGILLVIGEKVTGSLGFIVKRQNNVIVNLVSFTPFFF